MSCRIEGGCIGNGLEHIRINTDISNHMNVLLRAQTHIYIHTHTNNDNEYSHMYMYVYSPDSKCVRGCDDVSIPGPRGEEACSGFELCALKALFV